MKFYYIRVNLFIVLFILEVGFFFLLDKDKGFRGFCYWIVGCKYNIVC